jgi:hypothetical protein
LAPYSLDIVEPLLAEVEKEGISMVDRTISWEENPPLSIPTYSRRTKHGVNSQKLSSLVKEIYPTTSGYQKSAIHTSQCLPHRPFLSILPFNDKLLWSFSFGVNFTRLQKKKKSI